MARKYFGTDGVRGRVNEEPMTAEFALRLGRAAGHVLGKGLSHTPHILIAKDTRLSGYMIESALCAGFTSQGVHVLLAGPIPTPAVAYLTRSLRADAGVMISASHNPAGDNGIKFFGPDGYKLPDEVEERIEAAIAKPPKPVKPAEVGKAYRVDDARGRYIEFLKASLPRRMRFDGVKVVVDCANGAAYDVAPRLFAELGCEVVAIHAQPDGTNINRDCGSVHPEAMQARVREEGADVGFALDGDGDRVIACDAEGRLVDGDRILAILALHALKHGRLRGEGVVGTIMSNMGLARYLDGLGLRLHRAPVGDRYVLELMQKTGCNLGGEPSGHVILLDYNTTGDGLLTALQLLCAMADAERPLAELASTLALFPQRHWNLALARKDGFMEREDVRKAMAAAQAKLAGRGRLVVRPSGTEPKLRIMVEAEEDALAEEVGEALVAQLEKIALALS